MEYCLKGKSVLFFCTGFFSYYKYIKEELERMGAIVRFILIPRFPESHRNILHSKSFFFPYHYIKNPRYRTAWTNKLLDQIRFERYDIIFCVADVPFKSFFIDQMKERNPQVKTILFLWDKLSICYVPSRTIKKFDYKYSFDRDDCAKVKGLQYLPDFYLQWERDAVMGDVYDVCLIATLTDPQRLNIAMSLNRFCAHHGLKSFIYLLSRKTHKISEAQDEIDFIKHDKLTAEQVDTIQNRSRCIFDFSYKGRQGMTLNCIAALAKGKKLITSNFRIKEEEFYNPNNIYIYDYEAPCFNLDFFKSPTVPVDMEYLRLDNWLKYILCR